jgi:hypothetical protein
MSKVNYTKNCAKLAKDIKNTSAKNKEFKSKQEPKNE